MEIANKKDILKEMTQVATAISMLCDNVCSDFENLLEDGYLKPEAEEKDRSIIEFLADAKKNANFLIENIKEKDTSKIIDLGKKVHTDCFLAHKTAVQLKKGFAFPGLAVKEEYDSMVRGLKSLMFLCLCYLEFQNAFEESQDVKNELNNIYNQSESLFGDISDVEISCRNHDEAYSQGSIAFLLAEIGDYASWIVEIMEEGGCEEHLDRYLKGLRTDVVNAGILLENISYCCFDRNDIDIYPKIKNKLSTLEESINKLEKGV